jgi:hypothetical protein
LRFRIFKWSVYGLLALNLGLFLLFETLVEALDSLGWLVLLGVLEWETSTLGRPRSARETAALWAAQGAGYAVGGPGLGGIRARGDVAGLRQRLPVARRGAGPGLRRPLPAGRRAPARAPVAASGQGRAVCGLVGLALWWTATGELLNGFDAALWLLCFFAIEGNILRTRTRSLPCRVTGWPGPAREAGVRGFKCRPCSGGRAFGRCAPGRWIQAAVDTPLPWTRRTSAMNRDAFEDALQEAAQAAVEALARAGLSLEGDAGADLLDAIHEALEDVLREHGLEPDDDGRGGRLAAARIAGREPVRGGVAGVGLGSRRARKDAA